ncbi:MAG: DegT/DnrJ/EryC1/StrS family aminotransferase [Candidatus Beckwithbacteria bacterium]|nr:DegT/DnrJ/EryC1/StrS family aminotransferase [Candidatus Beckwithbacteria bacterium]
MLKPILIGISPNIQADDVWLALKLLFKPHIWQSGPGLAKLTRAIKQYFPGYYCYLVNAGRTALYLALKSLELKPGDEVIHLDFTCDVVPEAVVKAGGIPVPVKDLTRPKITPRTKALIAQHTFGVPDDLTKLQAICRQYRLVLIEDCAHSLGASYQGKPVGSFGDLAVLSFGRDKVISSVFGGALLSRKALVLPQLAYPGKGWIVKQLFHPLLMSVAVPTYFYGGKLLIWLARSLGLITLPLKALPAALMPNALAQLALNQWGKLNQLNRHRQTLARYYAQSLKLSFDQQGIYLRYPVSVGQPKAVIAAGKLKHLLLGNWYENKLVNLPTHIKINLADARRVTEFIKKYV